MKAAVEASNLAFFSDLKPFADRKTFATRRAAVRRLQLLVTVG